MSCVRPGHQAQLTTQPDLVDADDVPDLVDADADSDEVWRSLLAHSTHARSTRARSG